MDNGVLIFIVVLEAIIIVWLASKLRQYQNFEQMLDTRPAKNAASQTGDGAAEVTPGATDGAQGLKAGAASSALAADASEDELLDMPGVEPEVNIEEAKRVQLVMARCHYAEFYLEQLDDDYELGQFKHIVNSCKQMATGIADPFFKSSAIHPLVTLLDRAGWETERDKLIALVEDENILQQIRSELSAQPDDA